MSDEDIELASNWNGDNDAFVGALAAVGFLDGESGAYRLHDWAEHQPWSAGSEARSEKSKFAALCKQHGRAHAERMMPEYVARLAEAAKSQESSASGKPAAVPDGATGTAAGASGDAPFPFPSPLPHQEPSPDGDLSSPAAEDPPVEPIKPTLVLTAPTDIEAKRAAKLAERNQRLAAVTDDAIAAYNAVLGKPHGLLASVSTKVGKDTRRDNVRRVVDTARDICRDLYDAEVIVPEFWTAYFTSCSEDDFLKGVGPYTGTHAKWRPDFEYLTRKDTMLKVYDRIANEDAA